MAEDGLNHVIYCGVRVMVFDQLDFVEVLRRIFSDKFVSQVFTFDLFRET